MTMLKSYERLDIRKTMDESRNSYREVVLVVPTISYNSNYDPTTGGAIDITATYYTVTYLSYRAKARIKIITEATLLKMFAPVPGLEVGDYLLYFRFYDKDELKKVVNTEKAYMMVDGNAVRPWNTTFNGVGDTSDIYCHAKIYSGEVRKTGA